MTGAMLRRLREAYGYSVKQVCEVASMYSCTLGRLEARGRSRSARPYERARVREAWRRYIAGLRKLRDSGASPAPTPQEKPKQVKASKLLQAIPVSEYSSCPHGATHRVNRAGVWEWIRIASHAGNKRGYVLMDGEWMRRSWVEEQVLGITPRRRAASSDDAVTEFHFVRGRHG